MFDQYMTPGQVEDACPELTQSRLARWRWTQRGPCYVKCGRQTLYRREDIHEYLTSRTVRPVEGPSS